MESDTKTPATQLLPDLLAGRGLRTHFQPIVELASGAIIGYEALARGPEGSELELPAQLFAAAASLGKHAEFDRVCREVALSEALAGGLSPDDLLFLNVEPSGLGSGGVLDRLHRDHLESVSVVVELTERTLTNRPAEVLAAVRWLRERGCRIALDDVGVDPRSLALMPFVAPDLVKLDMRVTQNRLDSLVTARILNAVGAEAERSGTMIVAEGIETEEHLARAQELGATLGQGWLLGRPAPLAGARERQRAIGVPLAGAREIGASTPFRLVTDSREPRRGGFRLVLSLSHQLEDEVEALRGEAILLTNFQDHRHFDNGTRDRYERFARRAALVAALGVEMDPRPGIGVRGAEVPPSDELRIEWDVIVVGPHFAAAFVACELDELAPNGERQFDYAVTYDRELVIDAARLLLHRVVRSS